MVTHWESSKRPLYVKTVWQDGQHHVVLREEPTNPPRKIEKSFSSSRTVKSATWSYSPNLNVSSMKLLKTASSSESVAPRRCKTSLKNNQKPPTKHYLQKQVSFSQPLGDKTNAVSLSIKSNSIDIGDSRTTNQASDRMDDCIARYITYNTFLEPSGISLSERVLVWLDLATQSTTSLDQDDTKPVRVVTAIPTARKRQHFFSHRCLSSCLPIPSTEPKNSFQVQGVSRSLQVTNTTILNNYNDDLVDDEQVISEEIPVPEMLVSSRLEENYGPNDMDNKESCQKKFGVKRQLHIFMPDMPKKFSDGDSSLFSSKLSGCSSKNGKNRIL